MNLVYGKIIDVEIEDGMRFGNVTVAGAIKRIALDLVRDVQKGDKVLLCDGVAIAKSNDLPVPNHAKYVLGDSR